MKIIEFSNGVEFKKIVKGKNFVTPELVGYIKNDYYEIELSSGIDWNNHNVFGVTVANLRTQTHENDLSKMFSSYTDAINYIKELES